MGKPRFNLDTQLTGDQKLAFELAARYKTAMRAEHAVLDVFTSQDAKEVADFKDKELKRWGQYTATKKAPSIGGR